MNGSCQRGAAMSKKKSSNGIDPKLILHFLSSLFTDKTLDLELPPIRDEIDEKAVHAYVALMGAWRTYQNPEIEANLREHSAKIIQKMAKGASLRLPGRPPKGKDPSDWELLATTLAPHLQEVYEKCLRIELKGGKKISRKIIKELIAEDIARILNLDQRFVERMTSFRWARRRTDGFIRELLAALTHRTPASLTKVKQRKKKRSS